MPIQRRRSLNARLREVSAGDLRERLAFDKRLEAQDGYGNTVSDWSEQFQCAARIQPITGGEEIMAQRLTGVQPVVIQIRYSHQAVQIDASWRARDVRTAKEYNIAAPVNMDEKHAFLDILATAGTAIG